MKFISKSANYMIVLKPGIPANPITGTASVPGLSVRFRDGIAEVKDEDMIERMKNSNGFQQGEFIAVDDDGEDPYESTRTGLEPAHTITEIEYGHVVGRKQSKVKAQLPPELQRLVEAQAKEMAMKMLPSLAKELLPQMLAEMNTASASPIPDAPKKGGKGKKEEVLSEEPTLEEDPEDAGE